jgi:transposase
VDPRAQHYNDNHPSAIKKYEGLKYSGDFADAGYLAQLLRLGL